MNRLSWDSTAPRRPVGSRAGATPRPEHEAAFADEALLIRVAWARPPHRLGPF